MAVDGNLGLEQLLAGGVHVCGVGQRKVAAQLLFDDDAGGRVAEGSEIVGIDLHRSSSEELLYAAGDGGVEGTTEQCVGGGV